MLASTLGSSVARLDPDGEATFGEPSDSVADSSLFEVLAEPRVFLVFRVFLEVAAFALEGFAALELLPAPFPSAASRCSARVLRCRGRL